MKKALLAGVLLAVAAAGHATAAPTALCSAGALKGSFSVVPNSEGAGNIVYRLRLTNNSARACSVAGPPRLTLLGTGGGKLPTLLVAGRPGALKPIRLTIPAHGSVSATARFSPDIPGPGETQTGSCEATAHELRIATTGGTVTAAIRPATPVCEQGRLQLTALAH